VEPTNSPVSSHRAGGGYFPSPALIRTFEFISLIDLLGVACRPLRCSQAPLTAWYDYQKSPRTSESKSGRTEECGIVM
jgi:hypothetical protein